jgi:hypothetical protein
VEYINARTKVKIKCSLHGIFETTPDNHLRLGSGCPKCMGGVKLNTSEFILKAKITHNNKYDYSLVEYTNNHSPIKIICPIHGVFVQMPQNHINGCDCYKCGNIKISKNKRDTTESFIIKANKVHNNKYDYSLVNYSNTKTKVDIYCPTHGIFNQRPNDHVKGIGCPTCQNSIGENKIKKYLRDNNILFIPQKRFENCKDKRPLPFDFYLPEYNLCIEYDGKQHYIPNTFYSKNFNEIKKRDKIKSDFCEVSENPKLIRIPYWDEDKISDILSKKIT